MNPWFLNEHERVSVADSVVEKLCSNSLFQEKLKSLLDHVQLAKSVGYSAKELNEIKKLVLDNIDIFKEKWHEQFCR